MALMQEHVDRSAHYCCVIALVRHADDPEPLVAQGCWHGQLIDTPRGANGFGYDPYFYVPAFNRTAELAPRERTP
jgi:XTP/dITP diphosphohydrolase